MESLRSTRWIQKVASFAAVTLTAVSCQTILGLKEGDPLPGSGGASSSAVTSASSSGQGGVGQVGGGGAGPTTSSQGGGGKGGSGPTCQSSIDCPAPANACVTASCSAGTCVENALPAKTDALIQVAGDCKVSQCDGNGGRVSVLDATDDDDLDDCTSDSCSSFLPVHTPKSSGTACGTGTQICDAVGMCVVAKCSDGTQDGDETASDCGGSCGPCADTLGCVANADCTSNLCLVGHCSVPTCTDKAQNGGETAVDCGGSGACSRCAEGMTCNVGGDCTSGTCTGGLCCVAPCGVWSLRFGDAANQEALATAIDGAGNVFVAGAFAGSIDFGGGALPSSGGDDIFLAKFDSAGNHVWSKLFGDAADQRAYAVAVDTDGNVAIAGGFQGKVNFGGSPLTSAGGEDVFVAKFNASGSHLWSKRFGDAADQRGTALTFSGATLAVTGFFKSGIDFGGLVLGSAGGDDVFAAQFDAGGAHLWSKAYGDAADQQAYAVAADGKGHLFFAGSFQGSINFGNLGGLTSAGGDDIFVTELADTTGAYAFSKAYGDSADQRALGLAVDGTGAALVTGSFQGTLDFGVAPALVSAGGSDIFVAKIDATGQSVWAAGYGDTLDQVGEAVAVDGNSDVILTGRFDGSANFGGSLLNSAGGADIFAAKLDSSGKHVWSKAFGGPGDQAGAAVASNSGGTVALAGVFAGSANLGRGVLTSAGGSDAFLMEIAP